ncbi:hypothetical protein BB542_23740 [Escherichia coli]|uniref:hypothetical protein n=1 Tax=Escherichia coli TaxID=562 RepID=UPI000BB8C17C|nr:hypothetical protein [Escherichia coli]EAN2687261.1 hypothetical protein [Salmonella enterica]EIX9709532.1 hypothetical protein [Klebsiella pneumoniae]MGW43781.1 hypothetical protein [Salmonella enterica subsp. enterica serovar Anatum]PBU46710.1 hypothetical protein BB541_24145 [Escherichia coli]PBU51351.1 hypothetical protein BB542_23740 [Escherichia coli]
MENEFEAKPVKQFNENIKEEVLLGGMFNKLIYYALIVFIAKVILIISDNIPSLNALLNETSSTDAIYYTLSVMLLFELITYLTYRSFMARRRNRAKRERDLIKEGFAEGFSKGFKKGQMDNND